MDLLPTRVDGALAASRRRAPRLAAAVACAIASSAGAAPADPATDPDVPTAPASPSVVPVPDATPPTGAAVAAESSAPQSPETLSATDAFTEFRTAFDAARYEAAVPYARRVLALAEAAAKSPVDEEVQVALMNLAMTQSLAGDYAGAEQSYARAIELVDSSGRPLHARLARAYAGLASAYHDEKRHELAAKNFESAVGLTRRHEGLLTEAQVPLIKKYIDSLTELGRYPDALQGWKYVLRIETRKYGETSPKLAPTLEDVGRWYTRVGLYDQARRTFRRAIELIEAAEGEHSPRLIAPLTALAQCNRRQLIDPNQQLFEAPDAARATLFHDPGMMPSPMVSPSTLLADGERALQRAAAIADERVDPSPVQVADVRTQLGDWYQTRGQPERALPNYQKAWLAASRANQKFEGKPLAEALFGQPVLLQIVRPEGWDRYAARPAEQVETRNVVLEFTVSAQGEAEAPEVVDDAGDAKLAEKTREALRSARYRPRFEQGRPVATTGMSLSQPWIVLLPEAPDAAGAKPAGSRPNG